MAVHRANSRADVDDATGAALAIARDVRRDGAATVALSAEPWLRFQSLAAFRPGRFIELRYASSIQDAPVRPVLRFWFGPDDYREHILPAPCEGEALWIGYAPKDVVDVWISPTNRPGCFDFEVREIRPAPVRKLVRRAARSPLRVFYALAAGLLGLAEDSDLNWRWALGAEPLSAYPRWRRERAREETTIDSPRSDWSAAPRICLLIESRAATAAQIDATCESLSSQSYANWRGLFLDAPSGDTTQSQIQWERAPRFERFDPQAKGFESSELVGAIVAGDLLEPDALACFIEHFARHPGHKIVYCDELRGEGDTLQPLFKPGWSPILHRSVDYVGRAALFRAGLLAEVDFRSGLCAEERIERALLAAGDDAVGALRRPLFKPALQAPRRRAAFDAVYREAAPSVAIVVPTRDRPELLDACLQSVARISAYRNWRAVIVDNGSVDPRTHALFARLRESDERFKTIEAPGPFNFSALCNLGAGAAQGDFLVFLNNDTLAVTPDWIERLLFFATRPEIGAVGARLLFPNRRVQHVGVTLGMSGVASHFGAGSDADSAGWWGRNHAPHEVSAVTGACLMVDRRKFEAVGGFDAVNLPVELNDVDLCLRLAARGWRTICNTQVEMIHHQSASRKNAIRLMRTHVQERRFFCERWRAAIRDDPCFHPGLSLYAYEEALP